MKKTAVAFAVLGMLGSAHGADLLDIYQSAQRSDAKLASARMALEAGREKLPQARAGLLPTITLSGASTYSNVDASLPAERQYHYNTNTYTLQLTQPVFRMQNWVAYKQGELQVSLAESQFVSAQMDLMARTAQAYFDLLNAQDVLNTYSQLKRAASEQLALSKKSFEVGTVTVTDVNDAQARFDLASAQELAAQNDANVKREALRVLINAEPPVLARLRDGVSLAAPLPADAESWAKAAVAGNPEVQSQAINTEIASRQVDYARAGHLPTVDAVASVGRSHALNGSSGSPSQYNNWQVGLQASLPIFQGGATQSKVREAVALQSKAQQDLDSIQRQASQAARQSFLSVTSGVAQVKGYEAAVLSSKSSVESNKLGYQVGVKINIDVLNAQSQLADAQQKLAAARYATLISQIKLKQAVGSLGLKDMEEINALLDR